jgi:GT2 family glycosyltransferase
MVICADGTSKQRGHGEPPAAYCRAEEVLLPSGSAAMYRRDMLEEIGLFDKEFFLYCEDTDLGLRARWAGWRCVYVPEAIVEHRYSQSAGRASPLKAYYVERNRLFVIAKCFPAGALLRAAAAAPVRYFWHAVFLLQGRGAAAGFRREGRSGLRLVWYVLRAHLALAAALPRLLRQRSAVRRKAKIGAAEFGALLREFSISLRRVAAL